MEKILHICQTPRTITEISREMGYKFIGNKLRKALEQLLKEGKLQSSAHKRSVQYQWKKAEQ